MGLSKNINVAFQAAFEYKCICLMVGAYRSAIDNRIISTGWNENDITAALHQYIDASPTRLKWSIVSHVEPHILDATLPKGKGFADKTPRIDLRFVRIQSEKESIFFIEAKRLKEQDSGLKRRYIDTGISNFTSERYKNGCLAGYLLEGQSDVTIQGINKLMVKDNRSSEILQKRQSNLHDCYYESTHDAIGVLKHFIFDFTKAAL